MVDRRWNSSDAPVERTLRKWICDEHAAQVVSGSSLGQPAGGGIGSRNPGSQDVGLCERVEKRLGRLPVRCVEPIRPRHSSAASIAAPPWLSARRRAMHNPPAKRPSGAPYADCRCTNRNRRAIRRQAVFPIRLPPVRTGADSIQRDDVRAGSARRFSRAFRAILRPGPKAPRSPPAATKLWLLPPSFSA